MTENVQGFIEFLDERQTSFGAMFDLKVNGVKYGAGKFRPKGVEKGDYVKFVAEQKGKYWNIKSGTIQKLDKPAGVTAPASGGGGSSYGGDSKKQTTISRQSALNTSIALVEVLSANQAIPFGNAKTDKKADIIEKLVFDYAAKFYHISTGEQMEFPEEDSPLAGLAAAEEAGSWQE